MPAPIKVLVVDDGALYRKILRDVVNDLPGARTVGTANNGEKGIQEVARLKPDLVLLDSEMPVMNGLTALKILKKTHPDLPIVMVSSPSKSAADMTMQALQEGAVDFIEKPSGLNPMDSRRRLMHALKPVLTLARKPAPMAAVAPPPPAEQVAAAVGAPPPDTRPCLEAKGPTGSERVRIVSNPKSLPALPPPQSAAKARPSAKAGSAKARPTPSMGMPSPKSHLRVARPPRSFPGLRTDLPPRFSVLAIGTSTGGPAALGIVIPKLPKDLPVPVVVVQHMPAGFTKSLANQLDSRSALTVKEAEDGDDVLPGVVYIAPGGRHMEIVRKSSRAKVRLHDGDPVHNCRPSVDVLFKSLTEGKELPTLSLIMTGMGDDGSDGVQALSERGSYNLAQDEVTSVVYGMPRAVAERGVIHEVLGLAKIAPRICEILAPGRPQR